MDLNALKRAVATVQSKNEAFRKPNLLRLKEAVRTIGRTVRDDKELFQLKRDLSHEKSLAKATLLEIETLEAQLDGIANQTLDEVKYYSAKIAAIEDKIGVLHNELDGKASTTLEGVNTISAKVNLLHRDRLRPKKTLEKLTAIDSKVGVLHNGLDGKVSMTLNKINAIDAKVEVLHKDRTKQKLRRAKASKGNPRMTMDEGLWNRYEVFRAIDKFVNGDKKKNIIPVKQYMAVKRVIAAQNRTEKKIGISPASLAREYRAWKKKRTD